MKKTAKLIHTKEVRGRNIHIYKVSPKLKYKTLDGSFLETPYLYISRLEEAWIKETIGFPCDFEGNLLDIDLQSEFIYEDISEQEALKKEKYKIIK